MSMPTPFTPSLRRRWPLLLLLVFAFPVVGAESTCGVDRSEPEPLDERLVGKWRDIPAGESNPGDVLDVHDEGTQGVLMRAQHNRGNTWNANEQTVTIDGVVYYQQEGAGLSGVFVAPAAGGLPSRTLTLDGSAMTYQLRWDYTYPVRETGTFQLSGTTEVVLTRPEVGGIVTRQDEEYIELWSRGSVQWNYFVQSGPNMYLRDHFLFRQGPAELTGGWWHTSTGTLWYSFGIDGVLTEIQERTVSNSTHVRWRQINSYVYRNFVSGDNSGAFEVGERIVGTYELAGEDESELIVLAERPMTQRRHVFVDNDTLQLGGRSGWETYYRSSGSEGLSGTWSGGGVTWSFDETLKTYSRSVGSEVTERGRFSIASGSALISFNREYRWHRQLED